METVMQYTIEVMTKGQWVALMPIGDLPLTLIRLQDLRNDGLQARLLTREVSYGDWTPSKVA